MTPMTYMDKVCQQQVQNSEDKYLQQFSLIGETAKKSKKQKTKFKNILFETPAFYRPATDRMAARQAPTARTPSLAACSRAPATYHG
ncbi:hypothetical protein DSO57_1024122 [Entomophthora muscae]|uniref:Uncharacterized protein n=1 Tax=Entomophthora muscae TaxID=34485 RepID=A0ACC2U133_9FUNG|nr:hypothetical protein DSO57_1024122 [Entomophthora muscae]